MAVEKVKGEVVGVPAKVNEDVAPVVSNVTLKKSSGLKKFFKNFFAEDPKTVKENVVKGVIEPSIKSAIANAVTSAVYMWLFGKNGYANAPGGIFRPLWSSNNVNNLTNYANQYRIQNGPVVANGQSKITVTNGTTSNVPVMGGYTAAEVYDPDYIRYGSWEEAENVYIEMAKRISDYTVATVRNLYMFSRVSNPEVITGNWGWYDIPWHKVVPVGDGTWVLKMPQPTYLNGK